MRFLATAAVTLLALAAVSDAAHVKHESLKSVPHGWSLRSVAPENDIHLTYRIAVKQNEAGVKQAEQYLLEHSSNPQSDKFGHHLTRSEINKLVAPSKHSVDAVVSWLAEHGVTSDMLENTEGSDFISFRAPIAVGNKLLKTTYNVYQHSATGHQVIRATEYHVPEHIQQHIDFVSPTVRFPHTTKRAPEIHSVDKNGKYHPLKALKPQSKQAVGPILGEQVPNNLAVGVACNQLVTPECIRNLYGFSDYTPAATNVNSLGVTGYLGQYPNRENLEAALATFTVPFYGPGAVSDTYTVSSDFGGYDPQEEGVAGAEADLDVQYTVQLSYPTNVTFYSTPGLQPYTNPNTNAGPAAAENEPYSDWLAAVLNQPSTPYTVTTSYGDNEDTVGYNYAQRVCTEFMELGLQGTTVLFSSGDGGVAGGQTGACNGPDENEFVPTFPAGCPYVTAVGATALNPDGTESATYDPTIPTYASSGGFSNYFPRPSWQNASVAAYLKYLDGQYTGLYNPNGRGIPDVSALGAQFAVYLGQAALTGEQLPNGTDVAPILFRIDGTSAASPTFAGVMALVNDYRLSMGKPPVGFINPALYAANGIGFTDITTGNNGCSGQCGCGTADGFNATTGWDPVTGLGSPYFPALSAYLASLGGTTPEYHNTIFPASAFTDAPTTTAKTTTAPATTKPATTKPATTPAAVSGSSAASYCSPGATLVGCTLAPGFSAGTSITFNLGTCTNPSVQITGVQCCVYGAQPSCTFQTV